MEDTNFKFEEITNDVVEKRLLKMSTRKAKGADNLHPKLMKQESSISGPLTHLINQSILTSKFPNDLKAG